MSDTAREELLKIAACGGVYNDPGLLSSDVRSLLAENERLREALQEARELLDQGIAWSPQGKHHFWVKKVTDWMAAVPEERG